MQFFDFKQNFGSTFAPRKQQISKFNNMFKSIFSYFSLAIITLFAATNATQAQCPTSTNQGVCSGGNGVLPNNANLTNGDNFYWSTGNGTRNINNFNNGGTLTVCGGALTISGNYNGGTIIVREGATLTITGSANFGNNFTIINYGVLNVNTNLSLQGNNTLLINQATGILNVQAGSTTFLNQGARIANYNHMNLGDLVIQGNNRVALCMTQGATVEVRDFSNNVDNSIVSNGRSCISVINSMNFNRPLTTSSDLVICYSKSSATINPMTLTNSASAQLAFNCDNCGIALPIELISFEAKMNNNKQVDIFWATASELNNDFFTIERSADGVNWEIVTTAAGAGNSIYRIDYAAYDSRPLSGISYYRLKQTDFDGAFEYSNIVSVFYGNEAVQLIKVINIMGQEVEQNAKGLVILVFSNGETLKIINE